MRVKDISESHYNKKTLPYDRVKFLWAMTGSNRRPSRFKRDALNQGYRTRIFWCLFSLFFFKRQSEHFGMSMLGEYNFPIFGFSGEPFVIREMIN